jgi:hypothetical protein
LVSKKPAGARLPTHVLLVPSYMDAGNLERALFRERPILFVDMFIT